MTPIPYIETKRLQLRELVQEDFKDLCEIMQDPLAMTAYEHVFTDEEVQAWLEKQWQRYEETDVGLWAVVDRETGEMLGQAGLTEQDVEGETLLEIGYLFKRVHWGQGYATEAADALKEYAFEILGAPVVCSIIKADNYPSQQVAERIGMHRVKSFTARYYNGDMLHYLYEVEGPAISL